MTELEILDWDDYPGLCRKSEISDGSCFFHCIADAFYRPYQMGEVDRKEYVRKLRKELANALTPQIYNRLSRGTLPEFSKKVPGFSLEDFKKILDSNEYLDNRFNEYVSNSLNKDIYILDYNKKNVYFTGNDDDILYKNRESIVIIWYNGNHYDLAGILDGKRLTTLFSPSDPFIIRIKNELRKYKK